MNSQVLLSEKIGTTKYYVHIPLYFVIYTKIMLSPSHILAVERNVSEKNYNLRGEFLRSNDRRNTKKT